MSREQCRSPIGLCNRDGDRGTSIPEGFPRWRSRPAAQRRLLVLGRRATAALRGRLEAPPESETPLAERTRSAIEKLLPQIENPHLAAPAITEPTTTGALRVLERIGSAEARGVLKDLAAGPEELRIAREARAALSRLTALDRRPGGRIP